MTTFGQLSRLLATAAFLLLAVPAWAQDDTEPAAPGQTTADIEARAKALMAEGRHVDALALLGPLVEIRPIIMDVYFLVGLASIGAARDPAVSGENREAFLDIAVRTFRAMLVRNPGLVRVRLELARAYFLQGEDAEAKEHFERVLAGENPEAVVANVSRYLAEIRKRKRWSSYFGFALAPDSNIGAASDDRTINIFGLPFERDQEQLTSSGIGLSVWGGGEYQYPLRDRVRLRVGGGHLAAGVFRQRVRPDDPVGPCGPALAHRQRRAGERAGHCAAPPADQRALCGRPWVQHRGAPAVHAADDGDAADVVGGASARQRRVPGRAEDESIVEPRPGTDADAAGQPDAGVGGGADGPGGPPQHVPVVAAGDDEGVCGGVDGERRDDVPVDGLRGQLVSVHGRVAPGGPA